MHLQASIRGRTRKAIAEELRFFAEQVEQEADGGGTDETSMHSTWTIHDAKKDRPDITVRITAKKLMDTGKWDTYCTLTGMNPYAVNEGRLDSNEPLSLTADEAEQLDLIKINR